MEAIRELNEYLPPELHFKEEEAPITKAKLSERLVLFAKNHPDLYKKNIHKIGELGEELAYRAGHHIGIEDLILPNKNKIKQKLFSYENQLSKLPEDKVKQKLLNIFDDIQKETMNNEGNHLVDQGKSRGRGNPNTITRTIGAAVYTVDMNMEPFPYLIKNSLSEGFKAHDMFTAASQARYAAVQSATSTSEPGAMGKVLVANTEHLKICCKDCGTMNGVEHKIDDPEIIGRYEARTNKLITKEYIKQLKKMGKKTIIVRDPITCEAKDGVCAMCYGTNSFGELLPEGHNIGIEASQTAAEKATQLVLSTKHNIKGKVSSNIPTGFEAQKIILNTPDSYKGKATIATTGGKIEKISQLSTGGWNITIAGVDHYVSPDVKPTVKVGDEVEKGYVLSTGLPSTKEMVKYKGVVQARKFVRDKLAEINGDIDKRVFGVIARGYLSLAKNKKDPMGNYYNYDSLIKEVSLPHTQTLPVKEKQILNKHLAEPFLHYDIGTKIDKNIVKKLKEHKIKEIKVSHSPTNIEGVTPFYEQKPLKEKLSYSDMEPVYKTYEQRPFADSPLWQRLNYRGIKKGIQEELLFNEGTNVKKLKSDRAKYTLGVL